MVEGKLKHKKNKFGNLGKTVQKFAHVAFIVAVAFIIIWMIISVYLVVIAQQWFSIPFILGIGLLSICAIWLAWALISCFVEISIQLTRIADRGQAGWKVQLEGDRKVEEEKKKER